jgi:D-hexose-6-phosphate mutarotase
VVWHLTDSGAPLHGFARLHDWTLIAASEEGDDVSLTFRLSDSEDTRGRRHPTRFATTHDPKILELTAAAWINQPPQNQEPAA